MSQKSFSYLPQSPKDVEEMLERIGVSSINDLFLDIAPNLKLNDDLDLPLGMSEFQVLNSMQTLAGTNLNSVCFQGYGCYDHLIPTVVDHLAGRSEFYTAYTPYQAEISQGLLQAIFEYQTMICELTGLDVSNASLYDGASAAAEACVMAVNTRKRCSHILISGSVHPHTREIIRSYFAYLDMDIEIVPLTGGVVDYCSLKKALRADTAAVVLQSPNFLGYLEDYRQICPEIEQSGAVMILSSDPTALGMIKSQGEWGADIAVGDAQGLGLPMCFGGPGLGYLAASQKMLRKMPGRIVGQTLDQQSRRAFVLTLQAREQHIKRERATSNICSNQALAALRATIYLASIGKQGLKTAAELNYHKAHYLHRSLIQQCRGVESYDNLPFFNEFTIQLPIPAVRVIQLMMEEGIAPGVELGQAGLSENLLLVAVTEKRTRPEMDTYCSVLRRILS